MDRLDLNPLQIPLINCNIFKFLPFEEKKKWRALSRTFHDETLNSWSNSIVFTLDESLRSENGRILNSETSNDSCKSASPDSMQLWKELPFFIGDDEMQLREVPITNFRLVNSRRVLPAYTELYLPDPRWDFALFLERSGDSLKSLHIEATFRQDRFVDYFKLLLFKYCKDLKELSIRPKVTLDDNPHQRFFDKDEERDLPKVAEGLETLTFIFSNKIANTRAAEIEVCEGILSFVPNIKRLKVGKNGLIKMLSALPSPLHSSAKTSPPRYVLLKDLEIDAQGEDIGDLIMKGFRSLRIYMKRAKPDLNKLRCANFRANVIRNPPYYFHQFISDCKFTLTRLQLNFVGSSFSPLSCWISDLTGIDFQNLAHLILVEEGAVCESNVNAPKFDFRALRGMKKLKAFRCIAKTMASPWGVPLTAEELEFNRDLNEEFDWTKQVAARNKVIFGREQEDSPLCEDLEEFSFFLRGRLSAGAVRQLGKWMPSVKKLGLIADRTLFPVLFEVWHKSLDKVVLLGPTDVTEELIEETRQGKNVQVNVLEHKECYEKFNEKIF